MIRPLLHPEASSRAAAHVAAWAIAAALITGCTAAPNPPPADPTSQASAGAADLTPGAHVQVARQGQWYGATILQPLGEGRFLVHYDNTGNEWNEAVGPDRIKPMQAARDYRPGEKVLITYQNRLLLADVVMQVGPDAWRVHYDGFGPEAAENVGADRLRRPFAGTSAHAIGEGVLVEVNGQPLPAKVIALSSADHWLVRFDNFGPQYDQEVGADRIKVAAAPPPAKASAPPPPAAPPVLAEKPTAAKPAEKAKAKPAALDGAPAPPPGPPAVGEAVLVSLRGAWFPATVTAAGAGTFKVKYAAGGEEDVAADRVLREPTSAKGLRYQPGQLVLVEYKGVWVPGKVLKQDGKDYKIRFDRTGPENDEVIVGRRIKPR